jgi:hypothetical protein
MKAITGIAKKYLAASALGGFLLFAGVSTVRADEKECQKRTARADHNLHEAIKHHGADSHEAAEARRELNAARDYCWNADHRWWDEDGHRWRTEHDWDEDHGRP